MEANRIKNKICSIFKLFQKNGTISEINKNPIEPVNISVTTALSENDNFLV